MGDVISFADEREKRRIDNHDRDDQETLEVASDMIFATLHQKFLDDAKELGIVATDDKHAVTLRHIQRCIRLLVNEAFDLPDDYRKK